MSYETIKTEIHGAVGVITLNRPQVLNALSHQLSQDLTAALRQFEADPNIGCLVLTGSDKAFAAGADIKEMAHKTFADVYGEDFITSSWEEITRIRKPIIAAVSGYALGGGCEFALMCDTIFASDTAQFGQPEIKLGIIPGAGGTQRLARFVGKAKAMDMVLTGRLIDATEALQMGLVARVYPVDLLLPETLKAASLIASYGRLAVLAAKEAIATAYETPLREGIHLERRLFHSLFSTADQKEGMAAFGDKRSPHFTHR